MASFLQKRSHIFVVDGEMLSLTPEALACPPGAANAMEGPPSLDPEASKENDAQKVAEGVAAVAVDGVTRESADSTSQQSAKKAAVKATAAWFDVNDAHVSSVSSAALERTYNGTECAYMLFYARRSLMSTTASKRPEPPSWLHSTIEAQNAAILAARQKYDDELNRLKLIVVAAGAFKVVEGCLLLDFDDLSQAQTAGLAAVCVKF